ncbi:hypothetical protein Syun_018608 [Stephania yunnanensis]|uniref:Mannosyltransferase n=1 Tax=Stephania yunnanensis TaxID=152371 RepID=A0AAP0IUW9_9MAGN
MIYSTINITWGRSCSSYLYRWWVLNGSRHLIYIFMIDHTKGCIPFNLYTLHASCFHLHKLLISVVHLLVPRVAPQEFIDRFLRHVIASEPVLGISLAGLTQRTSLYHSRVTLGLILGFALNLFTIFLHIRRKFGYVVEVFFVILTALQFHLLFYCSRPLPNILALALVNMAYGFWLKDSYYEALKCLIFATIVFRCDMLLLLGPIALGLLLTKSISLWKVLKCCTGPALLCIGLTVLVDSVMWGKFVWPEFGVLWFNSVLNRSSEWGTHSFHWYFTSALPRSLLAAYPLVVLGVLLDRRILSYILPVFMFVFLYSKLPHKELRFIIGAVPMFNLSASIAASRLYNNRKKAGWKMLYLIVSASLLASMGCSFIMFMASYDNYPGGYALKALHQNALKTNQKHDLWIHIDSFSAMNGISRFSERDFPWRYSKEENIAIEEFRHRNFTFLLNEHSNIDGFRCLFSVSGFSRINLRVGLPPIILINEPKVFIHGNMRSQAIMHSNWTGCH